MVSCIESRDSNFYTENHFIPETKLTAFLSGDKLLLETSLTQSELSRIASPPAFREEVQPQDHLRFGDTASFYLNCPYI